MPNFQFCDFARRPRQKFRNFPYSCPPPPITNIDAPEYESNILVSRHATHTIILLSTRL